MSSDSVLETIDNALHDWDTSPDAMRWTPDHPGSQIEHTPSSVILTINVDTTRAREAFARMVQAAAAAADAYTRGMNKFRRSWLNHWVTQRHRQHQPAPLPINGHEYRRRVKQRGRRK